MFQMKVVRGTQNTRFEFSNYFSKIVPFNEIMWKNVVEPGMLQTKSMAHSHCMMDT